jgi:multiple sugar transport system permease protein
MSFRQFGGRLTIYLLLSVGAVAMVFPFYWMLSTSFKTQQEASSIVPVLLPEQLRPQNWSAAYGLGSQGRPGLMGGLFGGFSPGRTVAFEVVLQEDQEGAGVSATIPKPLGVLSFPLLDDTLIEAELVTVTGAGSLYRIRLSNEGTRRYPQLPLELRIPKESTFVSSTLAPDGVRSARRSNRISFDNITPGTLSYLFRNYLSAWNAAPFGRYFFNSAFTAVVQVLTGLWVASMAAFALARIPFWGREVVFIMILGTMMIPGEVLLIPNYVLLARLDWIDTYYALIVPFVASAFGIFLLRQFFLTLPQELFDAARIDGAGWSVQLFQIALPLALPGLLTYALFAFLGAWNALLWPLIVTNSERMRTVQVGLRFFVEESGTDYSQLMAASTLAILPIIVGFFFVQKQFIQGIARSGLK